MYKTKIGIKSEEECIAMINNIPTFLSDIENPSVDMFKEAIPKIRTINKNFKIQKLTILEEREWVNACAHSILYMQSPHIMTIRLAVVREHCLVKYYKYCVTPKMLAYNTSIFAYVPNLHHIARQTLLMYSDIVNIGQIFLWITFTEDALLSLITCKPIWINYLVKPSEKLLWIAIKSLEMTDVYIHFRNIFTTGMKWYIIRRNINDVKYIKNPTQLMTLYLYNRGIYVKLFGKLLKSAIRNAYCPIDINIWKEYSNKTLMKFIRHERCAMEILSVIPNNNQYSRIIYGSYPLQTLLQFGYNKYINTTMLVSMDFRCLKYVPQTEKLQWIALNSDKSAINFINQPTPAMITFAGSVSLPNPLASK